jgi:selenocysteine-specific elongation factor
VDRVFALAGAGTIVTGTVWSGGVGEGEHVLVLPAGVEARVRSIQVHDRPAARAEPGRRAALALVGLSREQVARGAVVLSGEGWRASRALHVELQLLPGITLKTRARVRVHHGTAEVMARISRTGDGKDGGLPARLVLEEPLVTRAGDRFVLRAYSPVTTIGGGVVVDPWADDAPARRRARTSLPSLPAGDAERVAQLVTCRGPSGLSRAGLEVAAGLGVSRLTSVLARASDIGLVEADGWYVARPELEAAVIRLREELTRYHAAHPLEPGMPVQAWRAAVPGARPALVELAEQALERAGQVVREASSVRSPGHEPGRGQGAQAGSEKVLAALRAAGAEPPSVGELAASLPGVDVPGILRLLARAGSVVPVGKDRYYEAGALAEERTRLVAALEELGPSTPAGIRDRLGRSRKWLIPLLEWADREGVTVRDGERRVLKKGHPR